MGKMFLPTKVDRTFHEFLVELGQTAQRTHRDKLNALNTASYKSRSDANLPRTARFKGPNAPSARQLAIVGAQLRNDSKGPDTTLFRQVSDWRNDPFNPSKYATLVMSLMQEDDDALAQALRELMWDSSGTGRQLRLRHCRDADPGAVPGQAGPGGMVGGCWAFNLSGDELQQVRDVMQIVPAVVRYAIECTERVGDRDPIIQSLWQDYFYRGDNLANQQGFNQVRTAFQKIQNGVMAEQSKIVISKSKLVESSVQAFVFDKQNTNQGAEVHLTQRFFTPRPGFSPEALKYFRAGVIIHELAHLYAYKEDVKHPNCYGHAQCKVLSAANQRQNADNYGLFAFEAAYLTMEYGQQRFAWPS